MQGIYPIQRFNIKLAFGIGVMMAVAGPLIVSAILSLRKVAHAQTEFLAHEAEELHLAQDLRCFIAEESAGMPVYVLTGNAEILQKQQKDGIKFDQTLARLHQMVSEPASRELLLTVHQKHDELSKLGKPGIQMRQNGAPIEQVNAYFRSNTATLSDSVNSSIERFVDLTQHNFDQEKEEMLANSSRDIEFLAFAAITAFFLLLLVGALLAKVVRQKYLYDRRREQLLDRETLLSNARKETVEVVAHDLKNPLSSILLSTQMAIDESMEGNGNDSEDLRHALSITLRSARSMEQLIHNLLDHAKIEAGQLDLERQPCDLTDLLRDVVDRFKPIAESKNVVLVEQISSGPPGCRDRRLSRGAGAVQSAGQCPQVHALRRDGNLGQLRRG